MVRQNLENFEGTNVYEQKALFNNDSPEGQVLINHGIVSWIKI